MVPPILVTLLHRYNVLSDARSFGLPNHLPADSALYNALSPITLFVQGVFACPVAHEGGWKFIMKDRGEVCVMIFLIGTTTPHCA